MTAVAMEIRHCVRSKIMRVVTVWTARQSHANRAPDETTESGNEQSPLFTLFNASARFQASATNQPADRGGRRPASTAWQAAVRSGMRVKAEAARGAGPQRPP
jgi:hypothetical protein